MGRTPARISADLRWGSLTGVGVDVDAGVERHGQRKVLKCCHVQCVAHSSETGQAELRLDVPDSITTWVTEAVGLSEGKGLGLAKRAELRTFKPFFVDFSLPYSLIRGEQTKVPLTVYNYLPTCAEVSRQNLGVEERERGQRSRVPRLWMYRQASCTVNGVFFFRSRLDYIAFCMLVFSDQVEFVVHWTNKSSF